MGKKNKDKVREKRQQQKKQRQDRKPQRRPGSPNPVAARGGQHLPDALLDPPRPDRLGAAVHVAADGRVVPDPYALLGLPAGERDETTVRKAWRAALERHPPESDPDGARAVREARDRLLDTARYLERELGILRAPDADLWELPSGPGSTVEPRLSAIDRLAGQLVLYALVEDALS